MRMDDIYVDNCEIQGVAFKGHIQVYDKKTGGMIMHIGCTAMLNTKESTPRNQEQLQSVFTFSRAILVQWNTVPKD